MKKFHSKNPVNPTTKGPAKIEEGYFKPLQIEVGNNFERAFRNFRSMVQAEQILAEWKRRSRFEKPSEKVRRKASEAKQRLFEEQIHAAKIADGSWAKDQLKKQVKKEQRLKAKYDRLEQEKKGSE